MTDWSATEIWIMPPLKMHLTALEITHSLTDPEIHTIIADLGPSTIEEMTDYTFHHRARIIKRKSWLFASTSVQSRGSCRRGLNWATDTHE